MKRLRPVLAQLLVIVPATCLMMNPASAQDPAAPQPAAPATPAAPAGLPADPVGYFIGMSVGQQLAAQGFKPEDFTAPGIAEGLLAALAGKEPALTGEQMQAIVQKIQTTLETRQEAAMAERGKAGAANLEKSSLFLEENAKKEGVKTLASGLQYKVLTAGTGQKPTAEDIVRVHYTGTLIDGTVFDSSVERGEPAQFEVGGVIAGWRQALQEMKVGDKWMLFIPPQLAYGERGGPGGGIGPNEALIFEVELLDIVR